MRHISWNNNLDRIPEQTSAPSIYIVLFRIFSHVLQPNNRICATVGLASVSRFSVDFEHPSQITGCTHPKQGTCIQSPSSIGSMRLVASFVSRIQQCGSSARHFRSPRGCSSRYGIFRCNSLSNSSLFQCIPCHHPAWTSSPNNLTTARFGKCSTSINPGPCLSFSRLTL